MKASEAKKLTAQNKDYLHAVQLVLDKIEAAAEKGQNMVVIDPVYIRLSEPDYVRLLALGYTVKREARNVQRDGLYWHDFPVISW